MFGLSEMIVFLITFIPFILGIGLAVFLIYILMKVARTLESMAESLKSIAEAKK